MCFPILYILNSLHLLLLFTFCQVCLPVNETAEIETGMDGRNVQQGPEANRRQKLGLVWGNRKKMSHIIKDYFYIPFFLLVILWFRGRGGGRCGVRLSKVMLYVMPAFVI